MTSARLSKIEWRTDTTSVLCVKWTSPKMPLSCCRRMMIAVPPMKPVMVECDKKSTNIPNLLFLFFVFFVKDLLFLLFL